MPEKDPFSYAWLTWAWVILISGWGGAASFIRKYKHGHARPFNINELVGELLISGFVGVLTFMLCESSGMAPLITAVLVGISGHMGSRAIFLIERWGEARFGAMFQPPANKEPANDDKR